MRADLHAGLWATAMTPAAGTPLPWWHDFRSGDPDWFNDYLTGTVSVQGFGDGFDYEMDFGRFSVTWKDFEGPVWEFGSRVNVGLRPIKRIRRKQSTVFDACLQIIRTAKYEKGRQIFALIMGFFASSIYASMLTEWISDISIRSHIIYALRRLKYFECLEDIYELYKNETLSTLEISEIKKYFKAAKRDDLISARIKK